MQKRFTALRLIGTIYKVLGAIVALLTLLVFLSLCALPFTLGARGALRPGPAFVPAVGPAESLAVGLAALLYGGVTALTLFGLGEGVDLLLAIEENTRATALYLRRQAGEPSPEG